MNRRSAGDRPARSIEAADREILDTTARSMLAGLVGWTICSLFASVAFNWTFYFVLALAVAGREIVMSRQDLPLPQASTPRTPRLVRLPA
jgi:hypothetical protein